MAVRFQNHIAIPTWKHGESLTLRHLPGAVLRDEVIRVGFEQSGNDRELCWLNMDSARRLRDAIDALLTRDAT